MKTENINLEDHSRQRYVPIAIYDNDQVSSAKPKPLVFLNHGSNAPNTRYSYLANFLANEGYAVICIQHDLIGDELISLPKFNTGKLSETRMCIWECWVANISYTIFELKKIKPYYNLDEITFIGHSTGGDAIMLFAAKYPKLVKELISLDGRRCPFPRNVKTRVLLFQANDTTTDEGVIPGQEIHQLAIKVIKLDAAHRQYSDSGTDQIKKEVIKNIAEFLG